MTCYFRYLQDVLNKAGTISKENKQRIDYGKVYQVLAAGAVDGEGSTIS